MRGNRAPAQRTRISRLKHEPNKNRASRARGPAAGRQELIGDVNRRVPGITFARLFLGDGISDRESMRPKVVQPVASDRIFELDRGDSFKPISTVYQKKFSSRSHFPLECGTWERAVLQPKNRGT